MKKTSKIRRAKMLAQGGRCYYCDLPMWEHEAEKVGWPDLWTNEKPKTLQCTAEHLVPRSDGGVDTPENIVAACWFCNTTRHKRKQVRSPQEHRAHVKKRMRKGRWLQASINL
ncbi:HNH endonuclease [Aliiroseovarius sp. M344]|uniref:HNH endonuclease n=1 Tax=Aliiroseovarius sp. M344 TaxID=2867010 RepID=UPI0021AD985A|nr:HNH endonuclease signature motif containing protein [Aliiroseovarius sp. M344]UWQ15360.1 HNH endonuclease [Aliiroseovarius sp. M344]